MSYPTGVLLLHVLQQLKLDLTCLRSYVVCKTNVLHVWFQFYSLCARNAHITLYDVTTWSWVNLVNPLLTRVYGSSWCAYMRGHVTTLWWPSPTFKLFLPPFYPDVTHVRKDNRPSSAFPYCKRRKAGRGLGTRLKYTHYFYIVYTWFIHWVKTGWTNNTPFSIRTPRLSAKLNVRK